MIENHLSEVQYAVLMLVLFTAFTALYGYVIWQLDAPSVVLIGVLIGLVGIGFNLYTLWRLLGE